ncbi:DsbA family protein [Candidatus Woesearchaeota archaeon]|nr:DsbA family protein [Candidatus Woesearchaeota archaeon]
MEETHKAEQAAKPQQKSGDLFWKITTVALIVILAVVAFKGSFGGAPTGGAVVPTGGAEPSPTVDIDMEELLDDDDVKGDKDAPVTIVEWSDYECPFCGRFYTETLPSLEQEYIKTGKVKFVYRDFPLSFHPNAQKAAEAAECAGEQGKYWEMHNMLFEQGVQGGVAGFKQYAKTLGLNSAKFDTCLDSGAMAAEVRADMADGTSVGIQGTPGFIVNGKLISGAQPFTVFKQVIDAELN